MKKAFLLIFLSTFLLFGSISAFAFTLDDFYFSAKPGDKVLYKNKESVFYLTDDITNPNGVYHAYGQLIKYNINDQSKEIIKTLYKDDAYPPVVHSGSIFYVKDIHLIQYNIASGQEKDLGRMSGKQFGVGFGKVAFLSPVNENPVAVYETPFILNVVDLSTGQQKALSQNLSFVNTIYEIVNDDLYFYGSFYWDTDSAFYKINIKTGKVTKIKEGYWPNSFYHDEVANMVYVSDHNEGVYKFSPDNHRFYFVRRNQETIYSTATNAGIRERYKILRVDGGKVYLQATTYFNYFYAINDTKGWDDVALFNTLAYATTDGKGFAYIQGLNYEAIRNAYEDKTDNRRFNILAAQANENVSILEEDIHQAYYFYQGNLYHTVYGEGTAPEMIAGSLK